jgi:hypothetical protein
MNPLQIQFMLGRFRVTAETGAITQDDPKAIGVTTAFVYTFVGGMVAGAAGILLFESWDKR